jgi:hypothetical protein
MGLNLFEYTPSLKTLVLLFVAFVLVIQFPLEILKVLDVIYIEYWCIRWPGLTYEQSCPTNYFSKWIE